MTIIAAAMPVVVALLIVDAIRYGYKKAHRTIRNRRDK